MNTQTFPLPVGAPLPNWQGCPPPAGVVLTGKECRLEPLDAARHADALFEAYRQAPDDRDWLYLPVGPFPDVETYRAYARQNARETDPLHFAIVSLSAGLPVGTIALMRQQPPIDNITWYQRWQAEVAAAQLSATNDCLRAGGQPISGGVEAVRQPGMAGPDDQPLR